MPGILTAATGFVAALTGLVAGLSQLGVFERRPPAPQEVAATDSARTRPEPEEHTAAVPSDTGRADSAAAVGVAPRAPARTSAIPPPTIVAPAPRPRDGAAADSVPAADSAPPPSAVLPAGISIEVVTAARICAPDRGSRRFTGRVAMPVRVAGAVVLPRNTPAVLRLGASVGGLVVRLDSVVVSGEPVAVRASRARVPRAAVAGTSLKPGVRVPIPLGSPVPLPGG